MLNFFGNAAPVVLPIIMYLVFKDVMDMAKPYKHTVILMTLLSVVVLTLLVFVPQHFLLEEKQGELIILLAVTFLMNIAYGVKHAHERITSHDEV